MALEDLTPVSTTYQGWQLLTPQDMHDALEYLTPRGYTGTVSSLTNANGSTDWQFILIASGNAPQAAQAIAAINDWVIIENDTIATVCPAAYFDARYQTTG
jgi:hypothetical protein